MKSECPMRTYDGLLTSKEPPTVTPKLVVRSVSVQAAHGLRGGTGGVSPNPPVRLIVPPQMCLSAAGLAARPGATGPGGEAAGGGAGGGTKWG